MMTVRPSAGPLVVLAATLGGAAAAHVAGPAPATGWLVTAALAGLASAVMPSGPRALLAIVAVGLAAFGVTARAHHGLTVTPLDAGVRGREAVVVTGTVVTDPRSQQWETRVEIRVHTYRLRRGGRFEHARGERTGGERHVIARAGRPESSRLAVLAAGDRVVIVGRLEPLRPFDRSRRDLHLVAGLGVHSVIDVRPPGSPLMTAANRFRDVIFAGIAHVPGEHRALVAGFLLGDTRGLSSDVEGSFRRAGLTHLLVVSGSNVAFVLALIGPLRRRLALTGQLVTGLAVVAVFAAATRFEPSVLRASVMAALSMTAAFAGRPASGLRLLVVAVTALVFVDPLLVHSIAFRLSCAASAGILLWSAPIARRIPGPEVVREPLATTAAAQVGVTPVIVPLAGGLPLITLPANLAAAWAAGPLTVWGFGAGLAAWAVESLSPELAALLHVPTALLAGYLEGVAAVAGRVPLHAGPPALALLAGAAAGLVLARRSSTLGGDGSDAPVGSAGS